MKKLMWPLLFLSLLLVFSPILTLAYEIVGNCVLEDRPNFRLEVCPHTFSSPVGPFVQTYTLWNKTVQDFNNNVFAAQSFTEQLEDYKFELWKVPVFDWVTYTKSCPIGASTFYDLNKFEGERNPHWGKCWEPKVCDANAVGELECTEIGADYNSVYFERQFYDWSVPLREIYYDRYNLVSGREWVDKTGIMAERYALGKYYYYNLVPASFDANQERTWRVTYRPDLDSSQRKWDLTMYSGESSDCLFDGNCDVSITLDPWFDTDFACKYRVDLNASIISVDVNNLPILYNFDPSAREIAGCSFNSDGSDFRPVSSDEATQLKYYFEGLWTDTDVNAWILLNDFNGTLDDDNFFVYFGNASAIDANDSTEVYSATDIVFSFDLDQNVGEYIDRTSNDRNSTNIITASRDSNAIIGRNAPFFDGVNGGITIADPGITFSRASITAWFNAADVIQPSDNPGIVDVGFGVGSDEWFALFLNLNKVRASWDDGSGGTNNVTTVGDFNDGLWHHAVLTAEIGQLLRLHVDGVLIGSTSLGGEGTITPVRDWNVGVLFGGVLIGTVDEATVWNRHLSTAEITVLYRNQVKDEFILSTSATELNNIAPDVNVVYPENNESFNKDLNSFIDVNVSVQDPDNNSTDILIDLNFSTTNTEGSGTVIVNDSNLSTAWTCDSDNLSTPQECKFQWDISGVANDDYFILVSVSDGNSTDFNAGDNTFTITSNTTPALDINAIDGNPDNQGLPIFRYDVDGNLTIDFNVFDAENDRLTIDLNYHTSQTQGEGTVLVNDLNLDSQICADLNFSITSGVNCSWDFNIIPSIVADNNYFILGVLDDGIGNDFNVTEFSFAVDNITTITDLVATAQTNRPINSSDGNVLLEWTDLPNEANYRVYRSDNSTDFNTVTTLSQNITAFVDNPIADNTEFQYRVQAVFASGFDTNSNDASAFTFDRTAPISGDLNVTENSTLDYLDLNWTAATDNNSVAAVIDYNVYRSDTNVSGSFTALISLFDNTLTHADTTAADTNSPNTPSAPTVTPISQSMLDINWTSVTDRGNRFFYLIQALDEQRNDSNSNTDTNVVAVGVAQFAVDCQSGGTCTVGDGGDFDDVNSTSPLGVTISGLDSSTEYCFRVKAIDDVDNNSALSGQTCGTTLGPGNIAPVLDINAIDGNPDNQVFPVFSFDVDGVLTIDMNVFDVDNNRLLLDLNFSTTQTQGTGTVITDDLNLTLTNCIDLNFASSVGVNCSFDWNIHQDLVADNNYFILGVLDDGSGSNNTDFNATEHDFKIDNVAPPALFDLFFSPTGQTFIDSNLLVSNFLQLNELRPASATTLCRDGDNFVSTCSSSIIFKRNIKFLQEKDYERILQQIKITPLATFNMISEPLDAKQHLGVLAEYSPRGIQYIDEHGNLNVDIGSIRGYSWAAIKALAIKTESLEDEVAQLRREVNELRQK